MSQAPIADLRVEQPDEWHTVVIPLGPSEEPPAEFVAQVVVAAFGHLPFADARLQFMEFETIEGPPRRLAGRFRKLAIDPPPDFTQFEMKQIEERRQADFNKGKI